MFPFLFERAGVMAVGDFVGGQYAFDFSYQINRVDLTALSPQVTTVLDLVVNGQLTGNQIVVPSGLPETEVVLSVPFATPIVVAVDALTGLTPTVRWQCISGAAAMESAVSQVDLMAWAERLVAFPPNVIPFAGGSLASPAISEANVEAAAQTLFSEWLGDYFDGNIHRIGVNASGVFPLCDIKFEQGEIQQPLDQIDVNPGTPQTEIRLTLTRRQGRRDAWAEGYLVTEPVQMNFWVRSKKQGQGQGKYLTRMVSELLFSILNNPENALALAEKGIKHLAPRGGVTIPSEDWEEKLVCCQGEFSWLTYFQ